MPNVKNIHVVRLTSDQVRDVRKALETEITRVRRSAIQARAAHLNDLAEDYADHAMDLLAILPLFDL